MDFKKFNWREACKTVHPKECMKDIKNIECSDCLANLAHEFYKEQINEARFVVLTGKQIKQLSDMTDDNDETEIMVSYENNGHSGNGLYAWDAEYPNEGSIHLEE